MKIVLVGNYENDEQQSMLRFAAQMARVLTTAGHEVRTVRPRPTVGRGRSSVGFGKWLGYVDKFALFPRELKATFQWANAVHICDHSNSFYVKYLHSIPHVVTCHDLLAVRSALGEIPQNRTGWSGRQLQRLIRNGLTAAQHIVCVSEGTRRELLRITGIPYHRVSLIHNSLNYPYSRMERHEADSRVRKLLIDPSQEFLLHVGGNQWYKNRLGVLRVFALLRKFTVRRNLKLVMVGSPWTVEMRRFVIESGMNDVAVERVGVDNEDLRALYSTATLMFFPSLQEGFGWPIIEAQACGCPVVTSNRAPLDEIGGNAAVYVDPDNLESAASKLNSAIERAPDLRESSLRNAARFKESATIDGYVSAYERVQRESCTSRARLIPTVN